MKGKNHSKGKKISYLRKLEPVTGMASETVPRFDWVDLTDSCVQLQALLQLCYPKEGITYSLYFYIAADTELVTKKLLPTVTNKRYNLYLIV